MNRVELDCNNCSLIKLFKEGEIPDKYYDGCPRCGSSIAVRRVDY